MPYVDKEGYYQCSACGEVKPDSEFGPSNPNNPRPLLSDCKPCATKRKNKWKKKNAKQLAPRNNLIYYNLKMLVYDAYGNICACCGEDEISFLCVDHVKGDGAEHRKTVSAGITLYRHIRNEGFPKDKYQLLCRNCNWSKGPGPEGKCIHQKKVEEILYQTINKGEGNGSK